MNAASRPEPPSESSGLTPADTAIAPAAVPHTSENAHAAAPGGHAVRALIASVLGYAMDGFDLLMLGFKVGS